MIVGICLWSGFGNPFNIIFCEELEFWFYNYQNLQVKLFVKGKPATEIDLRDIYDDMQSLYVRNSASQFFFKATAEGTGVVEGIIRYHPFLYDSETYPPDVNDPKGIR